MNDDEPLLRIIEGWEHTLRNGKVVWGAIVKANQQLWHSGTEDCPALLAWSPDQEFASKPEALRSITRSIQSVIDSNSVPDELQHLQTFLRDDLYRETSRLVPPSLTNGHKVFLSTIMVFRRHLPRGFLCQSMLPVCIGEEWDFPAILPCTSWSESLVRWWSNPVESRWFDTKISMVGGSRTKNATLPLVVRYYLTANIVSAPWLTLAPLSLVALGTIGIFSSSYIAAPPGIRDLASLVSFLALLCGATLAIGRTTELIRTWTFHQNLIDMYEAIWKIGGVPWSRFYLMPFGSVFHRTYGLSIKVLGHWFAFAPDLARNRFLATVTEASIDKPDNHATVRVQRLMKIPPNEPEKTRTLAELKSLFREFGEAVQSKGTPNQKGSEEDLRW